MMVEISATPAAAGMTLLLAGVRDAYLLSAI
jgi:hypothetical protein